MGYQTPQPGIGELLPLRGLHPISPCYGVSNPISPLLWGTEPHNLPMIGELHPNVTRVRHPDTFLLWGHQTP